MSTDPKSTSALTDGKYPLVMLMTLYGGPQMGYHGSKIPLPLNDGRILVCLAQRGECRHNRNHYSPGMRDKVSWSLPQIHPSCSPRCPSRMQVAQPGEEGSYERFAHLDPYHFRHYKDPDDFRAEKSKVVPADEWADGMLVIDLLKQREVCRGMHGYRIGNKDGIYDDFPEDPLEGLSVTPATRKLLEEHGYFDMKADPETSEGIRRLLTEDDDE